MAFGSARSASATTRRVSQGPQLIDGGGYTGISSRPWQQHKIARTSTRQQRPLLLNLKVRQLQPRAPISVTVTAATAAALVSYHGDCCGFCWFLLSATAAAGRLLPLAAAAGVNLSTNTVFYVSSAPIPKRFKPFL